MKLYKYTVMIARGTDSQTIWRCEHLFPIRGPDRRFSSSADG